ncbi:MAG: hypothetical protein ACXAEN_24115 [Candidatus Thorarchaeota archaeon]
MSKVALLFVLSLLIFGGATMIAFAFYLPGTQVFLSFVGGGVLGIGVFNTGYYVWMEYKR